jgi:hypothetical protein
MEQSKAMECESQKVSSDVLKPRNIYIYIYIYIYNFLIRYLTMYIEDNKWERHLYEE